MSHPEGDKIREQLKEVSPLIQSLIQSQVAPTLIQVAEEFQNQGILSLSQSALDLAYDELGFNEMNYKRFRDLKQIVDLYDLPKELKDSLEKTAQIYEFSNAYYDKNLIYSRNKEDSKYTDFDKHQQELQDFQNAYNEYAKSVDDLQKLQPSQEVVEALENRRHRIKAKNVELHNSLKESWNINEAAQDVIIRIAVQKQISEAEDRAAGIETRGALQETAVKLLTGLRKGEIDKEECRKFCDRAFYSDYDEFQSLEEDAHRVRDRINDELEQKKLEEQKAFFEKYKIPPPVNEEQQKIRQEMQRCIKDAAENGMPISSCFGPSTSSIDTFFTELSQRTAQNATNQRQMYESQQFAQKTTLKPKQQEQQSERMTAKRWLEQQDLLSNRTTRHTPKFHDRTDRVIS